MKNSAKLILGTVQFGLPYGINNSHGKPDKKLALELLNRAYLGGIRLLDTAEAYGNAQEVIGAYHQAFPLQRFEVITKLSFENLKKGNSLLDLVKGDMKQMLVSGLFGYMAHNYNDLHYFEKDLQLLSDLGSEGLIQRLGVSVYTNEEAEAALENEWIDFIQLPFNMFDNINQRGSIFVMAKSKGVDIHTRSVFLQGLFFKDPDDLPQKLTPLRKHLLHIRRVAADSKISLEELALQYVYTNPAISKVLIGVDNIEQLAQNLKAISRTASQELFDIINRIMVEETELLNPANW